MLLKPGYWKNVKGSAEFEIENGKNITQVVPKYEVISVYISLFVIFGFFGLLLYFALASNKNK
jgi:hypothetical protein